MAISPWSIKMPCSTLTSGALICPHFLCRPYPSVQCDLLAFHVLSLARWITPLWSSLCFLFLLPHKKGFLIRILWLQPHFLTLLFLPQSWPWHHSSCWGASLSNTQSPWSQIDIGVNITSATDPFRTSTENSHCLHFLTCKMARIFFALNNCRKY